MGGNDTSAAVALRGVSISFLIKGGVYPAVAATDLLVAPSEFVAIVGPTGCGKSTLLNVAAGLIAPSTGTTATDGTIREAGGIRSSRGRPRADPCPVEFRWKGLPMATVDPLYGAAPGATHLPRVPARGPAPAVAPAESRDRLRDFGALALLAAWVFLGERVTLAQGAALLVVLAALVALAWAERRG